MQKTSNASAKIPLFGGLVSPSRLKLMTIGGKITFMYAGIFSIVLIIGGSVIFVNVTYTYKWYCQRELSQTASKVAEYIEAGNPITEKAIKELNPNKAVQIGITEMDSLKLRFSRSLLFPFSMDVYTYDPKPGQYVVVQAVKYLFDEKVASYAGRQYLIRVYRNYDRENRIINMITTIYALTIIFGVIGSYLLGKTISRVTLRPIRRIIQTAEHIGIEDLSRRIEMNGPDDEIKELAVTFNDMISRLEISFRRQKQFVADASHELRTPISVIQGYANLLDRWGKNDVSVLQESIDSIKAETEHMGQLVKRLLFMAKAEQNKVQITKQPLQLGQIVEEIIKEMGLTERSNAVALTTSGTDLIEGDYDLIKQLFWIFTENAVKYSKSSDDHIWIDVYNEKSQVCVRIKDEGIGISQEDLPYIFERFYRADKSRTNQSQAPGTGLGLSIAAWIIKMHDAAINVESELGRGTQIIVQFKPVD
ncbi:MAG: HAMP domain-containing histidine kinase [Clostridiales bacterium]|jgi:signal transduction histidine kinase|nr:HAMP domain-containing histidine kinase [Clostridiales bacterium]